jgi:uncharacterized protein YecE (DUF72 family)
MSGHAEPMRIGCTGWSIPATSSADFPGEGSHLERYAQRFAAVEISSSFYRHHLSRTYARWAATVLADFRFAVKLPHTVTHDTRLSAAGFPALDRFLSEVAHLGDRLGPLLVQLPPSLPFDAGRVAPFFAALTARTPAAVVCEPRHWSWFTGAADALLAEAHVARVAADPALVPAAAAPDGWPGLVYRRLHGSPVIYRSPYPALALDAYATAIREEATTTPVWCFFDNTADGAAPRDALDLIGRLGEPGALAPRHS